MLASGFIGNSQPATTTAIITNVSSTTILSLNNQAANKNSNLGEKVKNFTSEKPLMAEIAYCESRNRQYDKNGEVLRGIVNNLDVGLFQINEYYHLERAKKMGYDIYSPEGNMAYARVLFNEEGPEPWISSSPCWSKTTAYKEYKESKLLAVK